MHRDRLAATRTPLGLNAQRLAAVLDAAREARRPIAPPQELAHLSIDEAYDVQDAFVARCESAGLARCGWKLGLTSTVKQRTMGIDRPVFGRLFAPGAIPNGASVRRAAFIAPHAEPELAFGLARPLDPGEDVAEALTAVAWVAAALEITDSRYSAGRRTAAQLVADNTSSGGFVIGERFSLAHAPRPAAMAALIARNGALLAGGNTADVLGHPAVGLTLLARHVRERGLQTAAGDIVLSGAITEAFPALAGDRFEVRLAGLGSAALAFI